MTSRLAHPDTTKLIGYARVSTVDQDNRRQIDDLLRFGVAEESIYMDKASGRNMNRPGWRACWQDLRAGDLLVIHSIDRLGRDLVEVVQTLHALHEKGAQIKALNMDIDTTTATGMFTFHVVAAMAEWERRLIVERTRSGLIAAKARGKIGGRKPKITHDQAMTALARIKAGASAEIIAAEYGVSRQAIYRKVDEAMREPWRLNDTDSRRFVEILLNPPEPNEALLAAAERYKAMQQPHRQTEVDVP